MGGSRNKTGSRIANIKTAVITRVFNIRARQRRLKALY